MDWDLQQQDLLPAYLLETEQDDETDTQSVFGEDLVEASTNQPNASETKTYTTVGSVFNPNATTPLQPPTRRPRARRYQPADQSSPIDTALGFQNALLPGLSLGNVSPTSPTPGVRPPEYSPLQQNYDRAVSPEPAVRSGFGLLLPSIRSGNQPRPKLGSGINTLNNSRAGADPEEEEPAVRQNFFPASQHFTTKGLASLASYPNPMQRAAKYTLAKATVNGSDINRSDTPALSSLQTLDSGRNRPAFGPPPTATGPPRPLTAGPPGQRQYKLATFEATIKALKSRLDDPPPLPRSRFNSDLVDNTAASNPHTSTFSPLARTFNPLANTSDSVSEQFDLGSHRSESNNLLFGPSNPAFFDSIELVTPMYSSEDGPKKIYDTLSSDRITQYYPKGLPKGYQGRMIEVSENWEKEYPLPQYGVQAPTDGPRISKIDHKFYSGTERYIKDIGQIQRDYNQRCLTKKIGVIGGERRLNQKRHDNTLTNLYGIINHRRIDIEEANSTEDSLHAAPLVNMAYATILQWKEASELDPSSNKAWGPKFVEADPAWIDSSDEGNSSFFSQDRLDQPKRKRLVKKTRRGY